MSNGQEALGKASLWTSILGIILPACFAILVAVFVRDPKQQGLPYGICFFLFVLLELVALGCGLAARRTVTGKAGLAISGSLLLLLLVLAGFLVPKFLGVT